MARKSEIRIFWRDIHIWETLRGSGIYLIIKIFGSLGAYLLAWYISKKYGPEGNGILSFVLTLSVLLAAIYNLGLNIYAVKIIPQFQHQKDESGAQSFYRTALTWVRNVTISGSLLCYALSHVVPSPSLSRDLELVSFLTGPVSLLLFLSHSFKARKNMFGFSLLQNNIIQLVAALLLVIPFWHRTAPSEPVWACILAGTLMTLIGLLANPQRQGFTTKLPSVSFYSHLRESLPMLAGGIGFMVLSLTDRLMLRFLDSTTQLGIYDIVLRLSNLTLLGIISLNAMTEPKFAGFYAQKAMKSLHRYVTRMTWTGIFISLPVLIVLGLFADFWLGLFGQSGDFLSGRDTLYILLVGQLIHVSCGAGLILLTMTDHQRSAQYILLTAALVNIVLNALFIPAMGIEGAALATTITTLIWSIWAFILVRRNLGFWMWR